MDPPYGCVLGGPSLGRSPAGRPHGLRHELASNLVDVSLPPSRIYVFPPVTLIPRLLPLVRDFWGRLVLIVQWEPSAPWFPFLLQHAQRHLHLRTIPFQWCGLGRVSLRLGTFTRWTTFLFSGSPSWQPTPLK